MKNLLKPVMILTPVIFALAACDAPPAEDPAADGMEMEGELIEAPVEAGPMDEVPVTDGGLEGGGAPADEMMPEAPEAVPPAGEDSMADENAEESSMSESDTETSE